MRKLVPVLLLLASCVAPPPRRPNLGPEIVTAVEGMYDDLSSRRWDALAAHFLPEASLVFATPDGPKRMAADAFIEMVRKKVENKEIFKEEMMECALWTHGNLASVWSKFEGREGNGTDIRTWSGIDSFTLLKVDGIWKIAHVAVSQDPKPPK